jgi:predicted Zn-dependent protease
MADILRRRAAFAGRLMLLIALSFALSARPVMAQAILRDAETESFLNDLERPIIEAAGLRPENVQIVLIQDKEINAFVAGGQTVFIHSGLIQAADNANEVQGVIAHELAHITHGDVIRIDEGVKQATGIMILTMVLGALAMAAGGGEAGAGIMAAGQQAAMGKFMAFTREQESAADQTGAAFLNKAGITGKGMLSFFAKLQNQEMRLAIPQDDPFSRDHPLTGERITALENILKESPAWDKPIEPKLSERFQLVKAKLFGYVNDPKVTMIKYPEKDQSLAAHYARAYAWHKAAYPDKADAEAEALVKARPDYPFFYELQGQILLESGRPREALASLRKAVALAPNQPLIAAILGHALISTEDNANYSEAKRVLRAAVARDNENPFAWYQLGIVYEHEGDEPRAALATAERYNLEENAPLAFASAQQALVGLPTGTPDWIRAQDIAMVSRAKMTKNKDKKK